MQDASRSPSFSPVEVQPFATVIAIALCAVKLLLHAFTSLQHYGYFRDELYYLDMGRHLDWGYVDAAPLVGLYAKAALVMGGSLWALRIIPAVVGAALIVVAMLIARALGGGRYAQALTGVALLMSPGRLSVDSLLSMNCFEALIWTGSVLVIVTMLRSLDAGRSRDSRLWLLFGVLAGIGLENKHSTLSFGFAVAVALLLSSQRREYLRPWIWVAFGIAVLLFLPNILWQVHHHWPTLEDLANVRSSGKNVVLGPLAFVVQQIVSNGPILFPVWFAGLCWLLWTPRWRMVGLVFVVFFINMELAHAKDYYLFPIYPMMFAAGAVAVERFSSRRGKWIPAAVMLVVVALSLPIIPLATWMLPPEKYIAYENALGVKPKKSEVNHAGPLPQPIGDQFGWPEMVREIANIYHSLPQDEQPQTGIFAGNYGEAGAVDQFGPQYGLPRAYARHQNYWYWGPPPVAYRNLIVVQWELNDVKENCTTYQAFEHYQQYGMGEENTPIYLCKDVKFDIQKIWWHYHHWN